MPVGTRWPTTVIGWADSSWADDPKTRRSTSGGVLEIGGACVHAWSRTQAIVAQSSAEAELYAATACAAELLWLRSFMGELGITMHPVVKEDASACIGLATRLGPGRVKHIEIKHLVLQLWVNEEKLSLEKVKSADQLADILTKPYQKTVLTTLAPRLGLLLACAPVASAAGELSVEMKTSPWVDYEMVQVSRSVACAMALFAVLVCAMMYCVGYRAGVRHTERLLKLVRECSLALAESMVKEDDRAAQSSGAAQSPEDTQNPATVLAKVPRNIPEQVRVTGFGECFHLRDNCPSRLPVRGVRLLRPCMVCASPYSRQESLARRSE